MTREDLIKQAYAYGASVALTEAGFDKYAADQLAVQLLLQKLAEGDEPMGTGAHAGIGAGAGLGIGAGTALAAALLAKKYPNKVPEFLRHHRLTEGGRQVAKASTKGLGNILHNIPGAKAFAERPEVPQGFTEAPSRVRNALDHLLNSSPSTLGNTVGLGALGLGAGAAGGAGLGAMRQD